MKKPKKGKGQKTRAERAEELREGLRRWLVESTGCGIQESRSGKEYPCGTCTIALLDRIGLKAYQKQYREHNKPVDRANEVWRAILQIRDND